MGRMLVLIALVLVAVWAIKRALARSERGDAPQKKAAERADQVQGDLVSCAHCGVNLPRTEALVSAERLFCSEEHARRGPPASPPPR